MKVYLCGPINGCTDEVCKDWRSMVKAALPDTLDPMDRDYRGRELEPGVAKVIVENDKADIDKCDALLVNYVKPSVGTSMEILYAWERKKLIVLLCGWKETLSPWLLYHSTFVVHTLKDAVGLCASS